jgi:hypothetical protein
MGYRCWYALHSWLWLACSECNYFTIQPRYKIRVEGDRVALEDKVR